MKHEILSKEHQYGFRRILKNVLHPFVDAHWYYHLELAGDRNRFASYCVVSVRLP